MEEIVLLTFDIRCYPQCDAPVNFFLSEDTIAEKSGFIK